MFVYCNGDMKGQIVGGIQFGGMNITVEGIEVTIACTKGGGRKAHTSSYLLQGIGPKLDNPA